MSSGLETFAIPNPLILAAVQFCHQIDLLGDSIPEVRNKWQRCVLSSSLGTRLGLNIDAVKTEVQGFDPEDDIPAGKQNEVFKLLKEFLKGVKEPPSWFSNWKEKRADKAKQVAKEKDASAPAGESETNKVADKAEGTVGEQTEAAADADAGAANQGQDGADQGTAGAAVAGQDAEFKVGDIVMGVATKSKEKWAQKGEIVDVLTKHYKVKMLAGLAEGESHKFLKACVTAILAPVPAPAVAPVAVDHPAAAPSEPAVANSATGSGSAVGSDDAEMKSVEQLFDE